MKRYFGLFLLSVVLFACGNNDESVVDPKFPSVMYDEPPLEKYGKEWVSRDSVMIDNINYKMTFIIHYTFPVNSYKKETNKPGTLVRIIERYETKTTEKSYRCLYKYNDTNFKVNQVDEIIKKDNDTIYITINKHPFLPANLAYSLQPDSLVINNIVLLKKTD